MQLLKRHPVASPRKPRPHRRPKSRWSTDDEQILVEHDLISRAELESLRIDTQHTHIHPIDLLINRGVYTAKQIDRCLATNDWLKRSSSDHIHQITSDDAIESYKHEFVLNG